MYLTIEFDGGTSCNIPRLGYGDGYGSFQIEKGPIVRCKFGKMSSNAAEINTAAEALRAAFDQYGPSAIRIRGDSQIALRWVMKAFMGQANHREVRKKKALPRSPEFMEAIDGLVYFANLHTDMKTEWRGRHVSVEIFGH